MTKPSTDSEKLQNAYFLSGYAQGVEDGIRTERARAQQAEPMIEVWFKPLKQQIYVAASERKVARELHLLYGLSLDVAQSIIKTDTKKWILAGPPLPASKALQLYFKMQEQGFEVELKSVTPQ